MKFLSMTALALVVGVSAAPALAQYGATSQTQQQPSQTASLPQSGPQAKPSPKAQKALFDLQTTINNKDWANLPAKVAAAQAAASTKDDRYLIARLQLNAAVAQNDAAAMQSAVDAVAQSGYLDPTKTAVLYANVGRAMFNAKQFAQAASAFQKASALDPRNTEIVDLLGRALFLSGQKAQAATIYRNLIQASAASGQKAPEETYRLAVQSAFDAKSPDAATIAREWVTAYPSSDSWRNALAIYRNSAQLDTEGTLDLLRLMQAAGALKEADDYRLFASADAELNNWNEAQAVLDAGEAAHVVNPAAADMREVASVVRAKHKGTAAELADAAKIATSGMALLHIGDRYYGMGDYAKAVQLYRMAQAKPDVDRSLANLRIGMALARSGDRAGATTALNAVTGPRSELAKYWLLYLNQKA